MDATRIIPLQLSTSIVTQYDYIFVLNLGDIIHTGGIVCARQYCAKQTWRLAQVSIRVEVMNYGKVHDPKGPITAGALPVLPHVYSFIHQ